jgi:Signal transduction histidine kinase regulating citrate/malate metabolism
MFFQNRMNKKMAEFQASLIEKYYAEVENMYRQVRGWRHDYSNHIQTLKAYMLLNEHDKISEYLDMLDEDLRTVDTIIKTGNIMVDAILNSKISLAVSKKITVNAKAVVPENLMIADIDLCVIIGNLLDNAIEACDNITDGEKHIRIFINVKNTQLYMIFTNSAPGKKMFKNGNIFQSRKGENHGFGLMRIDKTIEKYGGFIDRNSEDGAFTTEILLPMH